MDDAINLGELQASIRGVLAAECPLERLQHHLAMGSDLDDRLWRAMADLGWFSLGISEADGGLGLGLDGLTVLYKELGRALAPAPVLGSLLAADAIGRMGSPDQRARWLPELVSGELKAGMADPAAVERLVGRLDGEDLVLEGRIAGILDGASADLLLLNVELSGETVYVAVDRGVGGLTVVRRDVADLTRHVAEVEAKQVRLSRDCVLSAGSGDGDAVRTALATHAALAVAADAIGAAEAGFANTIDYFKLREQFGKIIGSFQALKHRAADHKAALVGAEALLTSVASAVGRAEAGLTDGLEAKALAVTVALAVVQDCIQLHGGIGFTWEHPAHLYLRRVLLDGGLFGTVEQALDAVVRELAA